MAANPERGETELIAPDTTYTLALGIGDIIAMEARTKRKYGEMMLALGMVDVTAARDILFAALQRHHAKDFKSPAAVSELMDSLPDPLADTMLAIKALVNANRRQDVEGNGNHPPEGQT